MPCIMYSSTSSAIDQRSSHGVSACDPVAWPFAICPPPFPPPPPPWRLLGRRPLLTPLLARPLLFALGGFPRGELPVCVFWGGGGGGGGKCKGIVIRCQQFPSSALSKSYTPGSSGPHSHKVR
jgi:hypothetical protein